jgi:hypothetical protein
MKCARCGEGLIREEEENGNLCFECFEKQAIEIPPSDYPLEEERIGDFGNDEEAPLYGNRNRKFPKKTESR